MGSGTTEKDQTLNGINLNININAKPLLSFLEFVDSVLQSGKGSVNFGNFSSELVSVKTNDSTTNANELLISLYPSDSLLGFVSTF